MPESLSLATSFDGWDTYNTSSVHAVEPLTHSQLLFRPALVRSNIPANGFIILISFFEGEYHE